MQRNYSKAILFIVFNRPDVTRQSFDSITKIKPERLYLASDGPRINNDNDQFLCNQVREIISQIDWDCEVKTRFNDVNLGCKIAVSSAIDWFFQNEEMGIIIEDDILASTDFFNFCDEMLDRFKDSNQVGVISGCNFLNNYDFSKTYFFSKYPNIWGWATWKRVWEKYDLRMGHYENWIKEKNLNQILPNFPFFSFYWKDQLDAVFKNKIDTWDFQFYYMIWYNSYLTVIPKSNLIINMGYNNNATHTKGSIPSFIKNMELNKLSLPNVNNNEIIQNVDFDFKVSRTVYHIGFFTTLKWKIRRLKFLGNFLSNLKNMSKKIFQS